MNKYHQEILEEIKNKAFEERKEIDKTLPIWGASYIGTQRLNYQLSQPKTREIAKKWIKKHANIPLEEFIDLLNSLYSGNSYDERTFGGKLLEYLPELRKQINPNLIDKWLTGSQGWSEVDSLCQMCFGSKEILDKWPNWVNLFKKTCDGCRYSQKKS